MDIQNTKKGEKLMQNLHKDQAIKIVNEILEEDVSNKFNQLAENAGEKGDPNFVVTNRKGETVEVFLDFLSYSINQDFKSE
jgi:hypothetical protein